MTRDQIKMNTKNSLKDKKNKKADDRRRKQIESDSSDNDSNYNSDSEYDDDEIDQHEYRKFLAKMFPSKHINEKIKANVGLEFLSIEKCIN